MNREEVSLVDSQVSLNIILYTPSCSRIIESLEGYGLVELRTIRVDGSKSDHGVFVFALSTCGWCKRTKEFLRENDVAFEYVDVDKCTLEEKREVGRLLQEKDAPLGFPVTIVDDEVVILGFMPDDFREALGL